MRKFHFTKRVLAFLLVLAMTVGYLPVMTNAAELEVSNKVADPSSFDNWQDYYGDNALLPNGGRGTSTWKAGGVWTDKSVYTDSAAFPGSVTMDDQQDNFLVALSALASSKEIVGQSSAPTDTMLVLDLSNSMDTSGAVSTMIKAANETIDTLLKMNVNNRVGVILYSGFSNFGDSEKDTATVILPLDRYTTTTSTSEWERQDGKWVLVTKYQYLAVTGSSDTTVSVASGTCDSNKDPVKGSKDTDGGTYIQNGLYQAYEEFIGKADEGVVQSGPQKGIQRTPIIVLMSDGAPTVATTEYNNVGKSDTGDGGNTTNKITFLTQLTAAWVKGKISAHYNNADAEFYTLGLGTANNEQATAVLNPSGSNNTLIGYWDDFNTGSTDGRNVTIGSGSSRFTVQYQSAAEKVGRNYVDMYESAKNSDELIDAFKEIVDQIGLQSANSATLVASGDADLDGYITVQDELGAMMEVKDVKGILIGSTLFSGEELAKSMNAGDLGGSADNATEYGNEFVRTVKERIGIDTSSAQQLINAAYNDNQLYYNARTGAYSNYIGWYGDADNSYLGFWDKETGITTAGAPNGAKYINKSYGYLGGASSEEGAADVMHIVVMVRTEIATGHQTVLFKIPSSMIPMVNYMVELEGNVLEVGATAALTVEENDPIRLVYEVGLPDDVNNINLAQKVAEYEAASGMHVHRDAAGNYVFYANSWDTNNDGVAPVISNLSDADKLAITQYLPESHFIPNTANERFYVQEDSVVYTKTGTRYTPVTSGINANGTYYFARTIVTQTNGSAQVVTQYEQLQPATIANSNNFQKNATTGYWEVKAGTIRQQLSNVILAKDENRTGTIANTDQLWVNVTSSNPEDYNIYSFLGNNGKLTVTPATGIQVTKDLTEVADGASATEEFPIIVAINDAVLDVAVTDTEGNDLTDYESRVTLGKTVVTLNLADGESAVISGLKAGTTYTVTEAANRNYTYTYAGATETVAGTIVEGVVTNTPVKDGNLYITKEVVHAHGSEIFPTDYEFEFAVTFVDADGQPIADTTFQLENNYDTTLTELTTDENGVMEGKLRHGETVYIKGIPAGATVTVEEVNIPANYTTTAYSSIDYSDDTLDADGEVTIVSGANATVVVTNTYMPDKVGVDISFEGTKNFDATKITADSAFTFKLQKFVNGQWTDVDGEVVTIIGGTDASEPFAFDSLKLEFAEPGVHSYRIVEELGTNSDITYDRSVYTFSVNVTIVDGGDLKAEVVGHNEVENIFDVSGDSANGYTVTTVFTNQYHTTATSVEIVKFIEDKGNSGKTPAGFVIETYEASVDADGVWTLGDFIRSTVTDAQGEALLVRNYDNTDFENNDTDSDNEVTYHFIIKEKAAGVAGWTYDATQYQLTVVLTKDPATGAITADFDVVKVDANGNETALDISGDTATITFKNTYDPGDAEVKLNVVPTVVKKLEGREMAAGEFTFAIFPNGQSSHTDTAGAIAVGTNDAAGNVTFTPEKLTFAEVGKYEYDVVEIDNALDGVSYDATIYDLIIEVTEAGNGTLQAVYYFEDSTTEQVAFRNTYTAEPTEAVIEGLKTIQVGSGVKDLTAGMFTFGLYDSTGKQIATTTNLANGSFAFDAITYDMDDVGSHTYTVKEIPGTAAGITYDTAEFTVTVEVADNGDGTLSAEVTVNDADKIEFVNIYESAPANVTLNGTKTLEGRDLTAGEFQFALYESNAAFTERNDVVKQNGQDYVTNDADGNLSVSISGLGMGYHYYILSELIPEERATGISYDANDYYITVQVSDSGNGQMSAITTVYHAGQPTVVNPDIVFKNIYRPDDTAVIISGEKLLEGGLSLAADDFSFELAENGSVLDTAAVAADGSFSFDAITYTVDDIGTHTYTVKEVIPEGATENEDGTWTLGTVTYDKTVYTVVVTVSDDDKDGALEVTKTVNGDASAAITFTNVHTPVSIPLDLEATKEYNKDFGAGKFTFTLEGEGFTTQEKTNDANGKVTFDTLQLTEAKTYTFTVKEKEEILWGFISWDKSEYTITVTVENQDGVLVITDQTITVGEEAKDGGIVFNNVYTFDGEGEVNLSGTKTLTGDRTTVNAGEFEFGLYDADGQLVESVKNDANGSFTFAPLTFTEEHTDVDGESTYTYTVQEIAGTNNGMTYDDTIYTVTVTVKDNDQGGIDVSHVIKNGSEEAGIEFENTYTITGTGSAQIAGIKTYDGKTLTGNDFTFVLSEDSTELEQVKNAADGTFAFRPITYTKADIGTHTYTVAELRPADAQQMEDGSYMKDGTIYDANVYTVEVTVADDGNGGLTVTNKVNNQPAEEINVAFDNAYQIFGSGLLELEGTKTLTGGKPLADGEFAFGLFENGDLIAQAENKDGAFQLVKEYTADELGEYTYTVSEILPEGAVKNEDGTWTLDNITYDPTVYTVFVSVVDDQKGGITVSYDLENAEAITFENTYIPDDQVVMIEIQKILDNKTDKKVSLEGFQFEIACGNDVHTTKSDAEGKAGFEVTFSAAHIGQTYEFKVSEKNTGIKGMTYDKTVYTVKVQVLQNEDGTLKTVINDQAADKATVKFTNVYEELVTPPLGDNFQIFLPVALMLLSVLGVAAVILTRRKRAA